MHQQKQDKRGFKIGILANGTISNPQKNPKNNKPYNRASVALGIGVERT